MVIRVVMVGKIRSLFREDSALRGWIRVWRQKAFFAPIGGVWAHGSLGLTRVSGTLAKM
jgi:hypothetical protein